MVAALALSGCASSSNESKNSMTHDPHSYSALTSARVNHLSWTAEVDFNAHIIRGVASWKISANEADTVHLDTKGLEILSVETDGQPASYRLGTFNEILGQDLAISIGPKTVEIRIVYQTGPDAEAVQWLAPAQTAGKELPFLFTQSQAILARSWIPCQDTPGVRFTYDAEVTVPSGLLALMSASNPTEKSPTGKYSFRMDQPISSYLLALAVGDIKFQPISQRSGVYAEDVMMEGAAWEFADLEKMIEAAEELYGPYRWERYDVLVLPPSFPFGGMENPRLTFATPTILAGDRSLTSLIAHELAHSWSGNLVTNATWNDFWLNEGFTVYFETRIMEKLYGVDYGEMLAALNLQDLVDEAESLKEKGQYADTRLALNLEDRNPDEGVTSIAYNKGYYFLRSIEKMHGRDKFDAFLKDYFNDHAFGSIDTKSFRKYIMDYYKSTFSIALSDEHFDKWITTEGIPDDLPAPDARRFNAVDKVIRDWRDGSPLDKSASSGWSTHEWLHFLRNLPQQLTLTEMQTLDGFGNFTESGNAEITTVWGILAIRNNYIVMQPKIEEFLVNTGRRKFLSPLYSEMIKTGEGKKRALLIYQRARPNYHFVATNTFDKLLNYQSQ